jgi:hypothetical protein
MNLASFADASRSSLNSCFFILPEVTQYVARENL